MINPANQISKPEYEGILFVGRVEDNEDPLFFERLRIRIPQIHDEFKKAELPWAIPRKQRVQGNKDGLIGTVDIPVVGSMMYISLQRGDPHFPIWEGAYLGEMAKLPEILLEDYPNLYGHKDRMANIFYVRAKEGKNEMYIEHASGTKIKVLDDGAVVFHIVSTCDGVIDGATHLTCHDTVDIEIDGATTIQCHDTVHATIDGATTVICHDDVNITVDADTSVHLRGLATVHIEGDVHLQCDSNVTAHVVGNLAATIEGLVNASSTGPMTFTSQAGISFKTPATISMACLGFNFVGYNGGVAPNVTMTGGSFSANLTGAMSWTVGGATVFSSAGDTSIAAPNINIIAAGQLVLSDLNGTTSP